MYAMANEKNLRKYAGMLGISRATRLEIASVLRRREITPYQRLLTVDDLLPGSYGVESLYPEYDVTYCNTGDTYTPTIYWEGRTEKFVIGDWGSLLEWYESIGYRED